MPATALNRNFIGRDDAEEARSPPLAYRSDHVPRRENGLPEPVAQLVARPANVSGLAPWAAKKAAAHIDGHLGRGLRISHVAGLVRLSTGHFGRAFKVSFGITFLQFVALRRIERSKVLMTTTQDKLCDVAQACGFADQTHFSKTFHRIQGVTPNAWRRQRAMSASRPSRR